MKFLIDAQLPPALEKWLQEDIGIDAIHVFELGMTKSEDQEIWDYAKENSYEIISKDSDFIDISIRLGAPPKIIWLTCGNTTTKNLKKLLNNTINEALNKLNDGEDIVEIG